VHRDNAHGPRPALPESSTVTRGRAAARVRGALLLTLVWLVACGGLHLGAPDPSAGVTGVAPGATAGSTPDTAADRIVGLWVMDVERFVVANPDALDDDALATLRRVRIELELRADGTSSLRLLMPGDVNEVRGTYTVLDEGPDHVLAELLEQDAPPAEVLYALQPDGALHVTNLTIGGDTLTFVRVDAVSAAAVEPLRGDAAATPERVATPQPETDDGPALEDARADHVIGSWRLDPVRSVEGLAPQDALELERALAAIDVTMTFTPDGLLHMRSVGDGMSDEATGRYEVVVIVGTLLQIRAVRVNDADIAVEEFFQVRLPTLNRMELLDEDTSLWFTRIESP